MAHISKLTVSISTGGRATQSDVEEITQRIDDMKLARKVRRFVENELQELNKEHPNAAILVDVSYV